MPHDSAPSSPTEGPSKTFNYGHEQHPREQPPFYQMSPNILAAANRILNNQDDRHHHRDEESDDDEDARIANLRYLDRMQLFQIRDKKERMKRLRQIENQMLNDKKPCREHGFQKRRSSYSCDCCYW